VREEEEEEAVAVAAAAVVVVAVEATAEVVGEVEEGAEAEVQEVGDEGAGGLGDGEGGVDGDEAEGGSREMCDDVVDQCRFWFVPFICILYLRARALSLFLSRTHSVCILSLTHSLTHSHALSLEEGHGAWHGRDVVVSAGGGAVGRGAKPRRCIQAGAPAHCFAYCDILRIIETVC